MLVAFMKNTTVRNLLPNFRQLRRKFHATAAETPFTKDPFVDEVCSGRLLNLIYSYFEVYVPGYGGEDEKLNSLRVSDLPPLDKIAVLKRGFGPRSQNEYRELLEKFPQKK